MCGGNVMLLKRTSNFRRWLVPFLSIGLATSGAEAAVVTYDFVGEQNGGLGVATGRFSYDTNQIDQDPSPIYGLYSGSFEVTISGGPQDGGFQSTTDAAIQVGAGFIVFPPAVDPLAHYFQSLDPSLINDLPATLDPSILSISTLLNSALGLPPGADFDLQVSYTTTSLELRDPPLAPVPLPAGLPLLVAGLGLLGWMKNKARPSAMQIVG